MANRRTVLVNPVDQYRLAPDDGLLPERVVSAILGVKPSTLQSWRWNGNAGPSWVKMGAGPKARVGYRKADIVDFIRKHTRVPSRGEE